MARDALVPITCRPLMQRFCTLKSRPPYWSDYTIRELFFDMSKAMAVGKVRQPS